MENDSAWQPAAWHRRLGGRLYVVRDRGGDLPFHASVHSGEVQVISVDLGRYQHRSAALAACDGHAASIQKPRPARVAVL